MPTRRRAPGAAGRASGRSRTEPPALCRHDAGRDRLYVGGWFGRRKPDRGCWYERIEAGLGASSQAEIFSESPQPRGRAAPREFDFRELLPNDGWAGEGYELINAGTIEASEQDRARPRSRLGPPGMGA
jgi:hypothetical protein